MLTEEQLKLRLTGIGGSEIGALVDLHPYMKPIDVYASKVHPNREGDNFHTERGKFFERPTADWWAHRHEAALREVGTLIHPDHRVVLATPDFLARPTAGAELDLSVKCPGPRTRHHWGELGSDEVPPYAYAQVQWELAILEKLHGITRAVVVAPLDGDLAEFPIDADRDLQDHLIGAAERFWRDHVAKRNPPPPDASKEYTEFIRKAFPESGPGLPQADAEALLAAQELRRAKMAKKVADEAEARARQVLEMKIGNGGGLVGPDWKITFKLTKGKPALDLAGLVAELKIPQSAIDRHTKRKPYKTFRATFNGEASSDD